MSGRRTSVVILGVELCTCCQVLKHLGSCWMCCEDGVRVCMCMYMLGSDPVLPLPQGQQCCRGCCCLWSLGVSGLQIQDPRNTD